MTHPKANIRFTRHFQQINVFSSIGAIKKYYLTTRGGHTRKLTASKNRFPIAFLVTFSETPIFESLWISMTWWLHRGVAKTKETLTVWKRLGLSVIASWEIEVVHQFELWDELIFSTSVCKHSKHVERIKR